MVRGVLGIGKTVLLAVLADQQRWLFIPCKRLTTLEILNDATNALYRKLGKVPIGFTDIGQAQRAFAHVASECTDATIVLDDVRDLQALDRLTQFPELTEEKILRAALAILLNFPPGTLHLRDLALIA